MSDSSIRGMSLGSSIALEFGRNFDGSACLLHWISIALESTDGVGDWVKIERDASLEKGTVLPQTARYVAHHLHPVHLRTACSVLKLQHLAVHLSLIGCAFRHACHFRHIACSPSTPSQKLQPVHQTAIGSTSTKRHPDSPSPTPTKPTKVKTSRTLRSTRKLSPPNHLRPRPLTRPLPGNSHQQSHIKCCLTNRANRLPTMPQRGGQSMDAETRSLRSCAIRGIVPPLNGDGSGVLWM